MGFLIGTTNACRPWHTPSAVTSCANSMVWVHVFPVFTSTSHCITNYMLKRNFLIPIKCHITGHMTSNSRINWINIYVIWTANHEDTIKIYINIPVFFSLQLSYFRDILRNIRICMKHCRLNIFTTYIKFLTNEYVRNNIWQLYWAQ